MDRAEAITLIEAIGAGQAEGPMIEVKTARNQLPKRLYEALSAFAPHWRACS